MRCFAMLKGRHLITFFDGRAHIRTLTDAVTILERLQPDLGDRPIRIKARLWRLPTGDITTFATLVGPRITKAPQQIVALPSSANIVATTTTGCRHNLETVLLHDARIDREGNVRLRNGKYLHNVKFIRTRIRDLTRREQEIVALAIKCSDATEVCSRRALPDSLYFDIDFSLLSKVKLARFAEIENYIGNHARYASRNEITTALNVAGIRY